MNAVILKGRLSRDPEVRTNGEMTVAAFTVAVDRNNKEKSADFISCKAFDKSAQFIEKYFAKGSEICLQGRIQTGSYTNRDGNKVYTTDVIVDRVEFCGKKEDKPQAQPQQGSDGFMTFPQGITEELPFM